MIIKEYDVHNLDCAGCSARIEAEIGNLSEVSQANLDFVRKRLTVQYNSHSRDALERLNAIASGIEPGVSFSDFGSKIETAKSRYTYVIYAGLLLLLISHILPLSVLIYSIVSILAYLMVSGRVLRSAVTEVFSKQLLAEHFLMSIASLGAMYLGEYTEAIAVIALYELGQYLEKRALNRSRKSVDSLLNLKPETAHRKTEHGIEETRLNQIDVGDALLVYAGERIPLDGRIIKGESTLDTSSISGESEPLLVSAGDDVYAGCLNNNGLLELKVTKKRIREHGEPDYGFDRERRSQKVASGAVYHALCQVLYTRCGLCRAIGLHHPGDPGISCCNLVQTRSGIPDRELSLRFGDLHPAFLLHRHRDRGQKWDHLQGQHFFGFTTQHEVLGV